ncbi:MAG TPA: hypothetical protein VGM88_01945 [Kofleriaceae bacterium]
MGLAACGSSDPEEESPSCDYTETGDTGNSTTAETTGIMMVGSDGNDGIRELCGAVNGGHFDTALHTIDVDKYRITTDGMADVIVRIFGLEGTDALGATGLEVTIFDTQANPTLLFAGTHDASIADHATFLAHLPAGEYDVVVTAKGSGDIEGTGTIPYKIRFTPDDPTRCPAITDPADYTEADDANNGVVSVAFGTDPQFQATAGTAEDTGLTFDHDKKRISGSSAAGTPVDDYIDRDTYALTTGDKTDELFLRLDWADAGTDLDFLVFEADTMTYVGGGLLPNPIEEYTPVAVKPKTAYWVWVGAHAGSTMLPEPYDLAVCGVRLKP